MVVVAAFLDVAHRSVSHHDLIPSSCNFSLRRWHVPGDMLIITVQMIALEGRYHAMMAALAPAVTSTGALFAGIGGIVLALLGPVLRMKLRRTADPTMPPFAGWVALFSCELVAALLLFSAGKAEGVLPSLATPLKVGVILLAALCMTGVGLLMPAVRREPV